MALSSSENKHFIRPTTILTNLLKAGLFGVVLGYLLALLLGRSVWLEMRFNIGFAIPVCTLACILFSLWKRIIIGYSVFLFFELLLIAFFFLIYPIELKVLLIIPACLFREGCGLTSLNLNSTNIVLGSVLFSGNLVWILQGVYGKTVRTTS